MKQGLFFSLFILFSLSLFSQEISVKGKVIDESNGSPLVGANIFSIVNFTGVVSNQDGYFELKVDKNQKLLKASYIGYETQTFEISDKEIVVRMKKTSFDLDEIMVTGAKVEIARKQLPFSVSVVSNQMIQQSCESSAVLPVVSENTPGMFVTERSITGFGVSTGAAGRISIRGISGSPDPYGTPNSQVLVLVDGQPSVMGIFGHPLSDSYVASDVQKVEIIKGPASVLYGSGAMGGVINIITKNIKKDGFKANSRLSYGSFNTQKYMLNAGFKRKGFSIFGAVNYDHTDGHRGGKDSSGFNILNTYLKMNYDLGQHFRISLDGSLANFEAKDPGPESQPSFFSVDITRGRTSLSVENKYDKLEGAFKLYYNFGEHSLSEGWLSNDEVKGVTFYEGIKLFKGNIITIGIDYKQYGGEGNSGMNANKWLTMNDLGTYFLVQQKINKLTMSGGIRLENNSLFGFEWVPQIGAAYQINNSSTIKGNISKGFRSPTLMELYLFAPNPDLKPEEIWSYELSIIKNLFENRVYFELTGYYCEGNNLITRTIPPPFPPSRINNGSFRNKGVEISARYQVMENLKLSANYSYINMKEPIHAAPKNQLYLGSSYKFKKFMIHLNLQHIAGLYSSIYSEPNFYGLGTIEHIESYTLLNCKLNYKFSDVAEFFISAENLLNQKYQILYDYPMPGISVVGGVSLNLNKTK